MMSLRHVEELNYKAEGKADGRFHIEESLVKLTLHPYFCLLQVLEGNR